MDDPTRQELMGLQGDFRHMQAQDVSLLTAVDNQGRPHFLTVASSDAPADEQPTFWQEKVTRSAVRAGEILRRLRPAEVLPQDPVAAEAICRLPGAACWYAFLFAVQKHRAKPVRPDSQTNQLRHYAQAADLAIDQLLQAGDNHETTTVAASDPTGLLTWAAANLKGGERLLVELLASSPSGVPLADLAVKLNWQPPWDEAYKSLQRRVNEKLEAAHRHYRVNRMDNTARLVNCRR